MCGPFWFSNCGAGHTWMNSDPILLAVDSLAIGGRERQIFELLRHGLGETGYRHDHVR
jgi:hypothetical protein